MTSHAPIPYEKHAADIIPLLMQIEAALATRISSKELLHLLKLRASQMNQCAYCVNMHTRDARKVGTANERLDRLVVHRHFDTFSAAEQAAFTWTEALTELKPDTDYAALRQSLREHYSEEEITTLTLAAGMINLWNRVAVSNH